MHSEHFNRIYDRTNTLKYSFIPNIVCDWDSLPSELISKHKAGIDLVSIFVTSIKGVGFGEGVISSITLESKCFICVIVFNQDQNCLFLY